MAEPITDWETSTNVEAPAPAPAETAAAPEAAAPEPAAPEATETPETAADPGADLERDTKGRFKKPRHRAQSQQAGPDDVPRIQELTRRLRETEAELQKYKAPAPVAATAGTPAPVTPAAPPTPAPEAPPATGPAPQAQTPALPAPTFPAFDAWLASHPDKTYEDYTDARADWRWSLQQAQAHAQTREAAFRDQVTAARAKYQDFDALAFAPQLPISPVMAHAIRESDRGADVLYHLGQHPDVALDLARSSAQSGPDAMPVMRRYLESLVSVASSQRASSERPPAAGTGSALALVPKPAAKPPNPVRTAAMTSGDTPPTDESSLEDHEAYFQRSGRRRRR